MFSQFKLLRRSICSSRTVMSFTFLHRKVFVSAFCQGLAEVSQSITVHYAISSNLFAIYGNAEEKELTELVPGILNQLGPDSLASLRKLAETYKNMEKTIGDKKDDDDDEIPDLVEGETFESKAAEVE